MAALTADVGEHNLYSRANRPILMARQANGRVEKLRLTYKQISDDVWELQDIGELPSKYALDQRESGIGPTEHEVREEFGKFMKMIIFGKASLVSLDIPDSEILTKDHVRLKLSMRLKGDASLLKDNPELAKNAILAGDSFIQTINVGVDYKRQSHGKWISSDLTSDQ